MRNDDSFMKVLRNKIGMFWERKLTKLGILNTARTHGGKKKSPLLLSYYITSNPKFGVNEVVTVVKLSNERRPST